MLDDNNVIAQRDPEGALTVAAEQWRQTTSDTTVGNAEHDGRELKKIVVAGMGGSALAALLAKQWLREDIRIPFEVVRGYDLPSYVDKDTLVIASSYSGNTEETTSALGQAIAARAQVGVLAAGGKLIESAKEHDISYVELPSGLQPRMAVIYNLRALAAILSNFGLISSACLDEIAATSTWLRDETAKWLPNVGTEQNYAKQLALQAVGKTPVFYGGTLTAPAAYKWKISWNENAKNVAFWNEYPEFNHNEFMGWSSHPVEKPYEVFDLVSNFEHSQILKRFTVSDKLLSGKRPKAHTIELPGDSLLAQLLWASILADFVSIYVAILNGVDPTPVPLIEKLKTELV